MQTSKGPMTSLYNYQLFLLYSLLFPTLYEKALSFVVPTGVCSQTFQVSRHISSKNDETLSDVSNLSTIITTSDHSLAIKSVNKDEVESDSIGNTMSRILIDQVQNNDEFLSFLSGHPSGSLCVIKFYSDTCPTCRRIVMKYKKIAYKYTKQYNRPNEGEQNEKTTHVYFAEINSSKTNKDDIATLLGIKEFPFIHIYRNEKCVASFGTGPAENFTRMLEYMLDHELAMSDDDWVWFENEFAQQIQVGTSKILELKKRS
jgi:hypothetical protein